MQRNSSGFGASVGNDLRCWGSCSYRSDSDDGAVVCGNHGGDELADETEMAEDVDLEDLVDGFFGRVEDREARTGAGVVDQDRGGADSGADGGGGGDDFGGGGDIAFEEGYVECCGFV